MSPRARTASAILVGVCLAWTAFLGIQVLTFGYGWDQGIFAVVGHQITDGGMPYRDSWDFKPPGVFLLYALARTVYGGAEWGIRVVELLGLAAMCVALPRLTRRWWGDWRIGILAAALAVTVHVQLDFWHTAQPESFGGFLTILALLPGTSTRRKLLAWVGCGVLFGMAGLLKPQLAFGGAAVAVWAGWRIRGEGKGWRAASVPALAILGGGILPALAVTLWFASRGALGDLSEALFRFTPRYTALAWEKSNAVALLWRAFADWLTFYSSLMAVGLVLLVALRPARGERGTVALLGGIIAVHLAGVALQGKFHAYHFGATWPVTALLAALGLWRVWERVRERGVAGAAAFVVGLILILLGRTATMKDVKGSFFERTAERARVMASGFSDGAALHKLGTAPGLPRASMQAVADVLQQAVPASETIFVWGFQAGLYELADRRPATRYFYNAPQRVPWADERLRPALLEELAARPPGAIVVSHNDRVPDLAGTLADSAELLASWPALKALVAERYRHVVTVGPLDVHVRLDLLPREMMP
jgi:hypothetical protein